MDTTIRKHGSCLETERDNARTMPGARRRGRPRTAWVDNVKTWTGLSVEKAASDAAMGKAIRTATSLLRPR